MTLMCTMSSLASRQAPENILAKYGLYNKRKYIITGRDVKLI